MDKSEHLKYNDSLKIPPCQYNLFIFIFSGLLHHLSNTQYPLLRNKDEKH